MDWIFRFIKEKNDVVSIAVRWILKSALASGILILFIYLAFFARFFPSGIAFGDSLLFVFITLAFGLQYVVWLGLGVFAGFGLLTAWWPLQKAKVSTDVTDSSNEPDSKRRGRKFDWFVSGIYLVLVLCMLGIAILKGDWTVVAAPLTGGVLIWIAARVYWHSDPEVRQKRKYALLCSIGMGCLCPMLISIGGFAYLTRNSFQFLGLYAPQATLEVNEENFQLLEAEAMMSGRPLLACESSNGKIKTVHGYQVWWHGIGERSVVEPLLRNTKDAGTRIELKRDGMNVVRWEKPPKNLKTCATLLSDSAFDSYGDKLNELGDRQINIINDKLFLIKTMGFKINHLVVVAHSDRTPVFRVGDSNIALSTRRAKEVASRLASSASNITYYGVGATEPKVQCPDLKDPKALEECLMPNRRVTISAELTWTLSEDTLAKQSEY